MEFMGQVFITSSGVARATPTEPLPEALLNCNTLLRELAECLFTYVCNCNRSTAAPKSRQALFKRASVTQ